MSEATFQIIPPTISSGSIYLFTTDQAVDYEVRFARKKDNLLKATIAFGVLNEEYEGEEYVLTNLGDVYRVMNTISEVVRMYMRQHPNIRSFEFTGEPTSKDAATGPSKRMLLYLRYIPRIFDMKVWKTAQNGNKMVITRKMNF